MAKKHSTPVSNAESRAARARNRAHRKELTELMDYLANQAFSSIFDRTFKASLRLKYPVSTSQFIQMYFQAMERQIQWREKGSGVSR